MGSHPVNLAIRFLLELTALAAMGIWGWKLSDTWIRFVLVMAIPILAAAVWGIFAVPKDPSRSGSAPIPISGLLRLAIEFAFFAFAIWIFYDLEYTRLSWIMGSTVIVHYIVSYDRIRWLVVK